MHQTHDHPMGDSQRILKVGIALTVCIFLLELLGGIGSHSLALMSDAWHIFIDIWALVLSFLALFVARLPVNDRRTFGFHRMEVFAAAINSLTVFLIAAGILRAAWRRWQTPVAVHVGPLLAIAAGGLFLNIIVAWLLYKPSKGDSNLRGAFLHIVGDALNTVAVLAAGVVIHYTGWQRADAVVSGLVAVVVLWGSGRLLRESVNTLLEGVPPGIQVGEVEAKIKAIPGVESVHDLHVWSICSHLKALSGHVLVKEDRMPEQHQILESIGHALKDQFGIVHTTIQMESKSWPMEERLERVGNG